MPPKEPAYPKKHNWKLNFISVISIIPTNQQSNIPFELNIVF